MWEGGVSADASREGIKDRGLPSCAADAHVVCWHQGSGRENRRKKGQRRRQRPHHTQRKHRRGCSLTHIRQGGRRAAHPPDDEGPRPLDQSRPSPGPSINRTCPHSRPLPPRWDPPALPLLFIHSIDRGSSGKEGGKGPSGRLEHPRPNAHDEHTITIHTARGLRKKRIRRRRNGRALVTKPTPVAGLLLAPRSSLDRDLDARHLVFGSRYALLDLLCSPWSFLGHAASWAAQCLLHHIERRRRHVGIPFGVLGLSSLVSRLAPSSSATHACMHDASSLADDGRLAFDRSGAWRRGKPALRLGSCLDHQGIH